MSLYKDICQLFTLSQSDIGNDVSILDKYVAGPPVVPQYYSTQPPWGIYLATPVQQQQQQPQAGAPPPQPPAPPMDNPLHQLLRSQNTARPLTPQSHQLPVAQPDAGLQLHSQGQTGQIFQKFSR